ncbi:ZP domain-containing protein-like [Diadema antillarum]|uniref:ZP domain-containing protein-like n=1 Tax=Diadema antillarum TaxID=105358 RepID=UPI003A8BAED7
MSFNLTCKYPRNTTLTATWYKLSKDYIIDRNLEDTGVLMPILKFYPGPEYTNPFVVLPVVVRLNDFLYFAVVIEDIHLDLSIQSCRATLGVNYDVEGSHHYDFIKDWAVADGEEETEVVCPYTESITTVRVKTRAFRFLAGNADQVIFIHCDVYVCDRDDEDSKCKEAYNSAYKTSNRRRRETEYAPPPLPIQRVTSGPIRIARDTQSSWIESDYHGDVQPWTSPLWGAAVLAMGAVIIVLLAALVLTLRKLSGNPGSGKTDEEEGVGLIGNEQQMEIDSFGLPMSPHGHNLRDLPNQSARRPVGEFLAMSVGHRPVTNQRPTGHH